MEYRGHGKKAVIAGSSVHNTSVERMRKRMEEYRGHGKKAVIAGSSVHNTSVERMHRDVKEQVVEPF
jgi:hypothetical protein